MAVEYCSKRISQLPPYLFAELDRMKAELTQRGVDVIDLSVGDPDLATPQLIVDALREAAQNPRNHRYPEYAGGDLFRQTVCRWFEERFKVDLDPDQEVLAVIGSKEGIAHLPLAILDPGDVALVPDPGYPVYANATTFAGGEVFSMPLRSETKFLPDLDSILEPIRKKAKLMFLNYPNNPTTAVAEASWFSEVVAFAKKHQILICHDAAYCEVGLGGYEPASFLQAEGAKEVGVEFHSLSKMFNMTGWRVGFAVGQPKALAALGKIKTNIDSGVFGAIQEAAVMGLEHWREFRPPLARILQRRRDIVAESLNRFKISFELPRATFYFWCQIPSEETSTQFCGRVLSETGVSLTPGVGFGASGEGYFRISLTASEVRLQEAMSRMKRLF